MAHQFQCDLVKWELSRAERGMELSAYVSGVTFWLCSEANWTGMVWSPVIVENVASHVHMCACLPVPVYKFILTAVPFLDTWNWLNVDSITAKLTYWSESVKTKQQQKKTPVHFVTVFDNLYLQLQRVVTLHKRSDRVGMSYSNVLTVTVTFLGI